MDVTRCASGIQRSRVDHLGVAAGVGHGDGDAFWAIAADGKGFLAFALDGRPGLKGLAGRDREGVGSPVSDALTGVAVSLPVSLALSEQARVVASASVRIGLVMAVPSASGDAGI